MWMSESVSSSERRSGSRLLLPSLLTGSWTWNTRFAGVGGVTLSRSLILGTGLVCSVEDKFKLGLSDIEELSPTDSQSELVTRDDFKFWQDMTVDFTSVSEEVNSEEDNSDEYNWKSRLRRWKNVSVFRWSRNSWELWTASFLQSELSNFWNWRRFRILCFVGLEFEKLDAERWLLLDAELENKSKWKCWRWSCS